MASWIWPEFGSGISKNSHINTERLYYTVTAAAIESAFILEGVSKLGASKMNNLHMIRYFRLDRANQ